MRHISQKLQTSFLNSHQDVDPLAVFLPSTSVPDIWYSLFVIRMRLHKSIFLVSFAMFALLVTVSCAQEAQIKSYPAVVGDIEYDPAVDDPGFRVCGGGEIYHYYSFGKCVQFKGEKPAIVDYFKKNFKGQFKGENGYVTIRFVVNCDGYSGRFRMQQMDFDFQPKTFSKGLTTQLLTLTTNLQGWIPAMYEDRTYDYYQYLSFKIEDGIITEILP